MKCNARDKIIKRESVEQAVTYMLLAFIQTLGDWYHWPNYKIVSAMRRVKDHADSIQQGYTNITEARREVYEEYKIEFDEDGNVYTETRLPMIYDRDEWKPLSDVKPAENGSYLITTDKGAVCAAHWYGTEFSGSAGKHAVAWRELPEPWEFWSEQED